MLKPASTASTAVKFSLGRCLVAAVAFSGLCCGTPHGAASQDETRPFYELRLTPNEFRVLNATITAGIEKDGSGPGVEFRAEPSKIDGGAVAWKVVFSSRDVLEMLDVWLGRSTLTFLRESDSFRDAWYQPQTTETLSAVQGLAAGIESARRNPRWPEVRVTGEVTWTTDSAVIVSDGRPPLAVTGPAAVLSQSLDGSRATLLGYRKTTDTLELLHATPAPRDTVEVFTMGLCPYGAKAAAEMLALARREAVTSSPVQVQVHYLMTTRGPEAGGDGEAGPVFSTAHGARELVENGVQILLRDRHPDHFPAYLRARADDLASTWTRVAETAGVPPEAVQSISSELARPGLLQHLLGLEYQHMMTAYGQLQASPTYGWEGTRIDSPQAVPELAEIGDLLPEGACGTPH